MTFVTPTIPNGYTYLVISAGTAAGSEPTWPTAIGQRVVSNTVTFMCVRDSRPIDTVDWDAEMTIREAAGPNEDPYSGAQVAHLTVTNGRLEVGFDPPTRLSSHAYAVGERIVPPVLTGFVYECIDAGTSDSSPPNFSTADDASTIALGDTVTDDGVIWRCVLEDNTDGLLTNLRIALDSTYTRTLDDFGLGVFTLEVVEESGERWTYARGPAVIERTTNY